MHPVPDMAPSLKVEEEEPPTYKELNPGVIHAFTLHPYDRCGQAGFYHLSARPASLLDPRQGSGIWSTRPGAFGNG
jgi:hypothetical protein